MNISIIKTRPLLLEGAKTQRQIKREEKKAQRTETLEKDLREKRTKMA